MKLFFLESNVWRSARRMRGVTLAALLGCSTVSSVFAHLGGPSTVTVKVNQAVTWRITADVVESQPSQYEMVLNSDPAISLATPDNFVSYNYGEFTITGLKPGTNTIEFEWVYAPNKAGGTFVVTVVVVTDKPSSAAGHNASVNSGDPVNTLTGELTMEKGPDLFLGGPMPLYFRRYYASGLKADALVASGLRDNWMHNFDLRFIQWPGTNQTGTNLTVAYDRGRQIAFQKRGTNWVLVAPLDVPCQLLQQGTNFTLLDPQDSRFYHFNGKGRLTSISDRNGNTHTLTYTGNVLTKVSDGLGRNLTMTYGDFNDLERLSDGTRTVSFTYLNYGGVSDVLYSVTNAMGRVTYYNYDLFIGSGDHLLSEVRPLQNAPFSQTYDAKGRVLTQTDAQNNTTTFAYNSTVTTVVDPAGYSRVYTYDTNGFLVSVTDQNGKVSTFGGDSDGRRSTANDRLGATSSQTYDPASGKISTLLDAAGRLTRYFYAAQQQSGFTFFNLTNVTYPDNTVLSITYDAAGNPLTITDRSTNKWTYTYDAHGQVLTVKNPAGALCHYAYNADGTKASYTDYSGHVTTFQYDALRRLTGIHFADGAVRRWGYDADDNLTRTTNELGKVVVYARDANDNLAGITDPIGNAVRFAYDGNDRLIRLTNELGQVYSYTYDALGRMVRASNPLGQTAAIGYNPVGWPVSLTDASGASLGMAFDAEGVPAALTNSLGQVWSYRTDALGRPVAQISPLSATRSFSYDALNRLASATDPLGNTTSFLYDVAGQPRQITLPSGASAQFVRNALEEVVVCIDPNGHRWTNSYDTAGRLTKQLDPIGRTVSFTYDTRDRLSVMTYPDGTVTRTYDAAGRLIQRLFSTNTIKYAYDADDRLTNANGVSLSYDAAGHAINCNGLAMTRDVLGRLASVSYAPGMSVTYRYDVRGQVIAVQDWVGGTTSLAYDNAGHLTSLTRPNGITTTYIYDADGQLSGVSEARATNYFAILVTRDPAGREIQSARSALPPASPSSQTSFPVNAADNVTTCVYDTHGRVVSDGQRTNKWDLDGRLISYVQAGKTNLLAYDALGTRVSRTVSGVTTNYVVNYAFHFPALSVVRRGANDLRYYVYLPDGRLLHSVEAAGFARRFYHYDEVGTTVFLSDDLANMTDTYSVSPFGQILSVTGTTDNPFVFVGAYGVMSEGNGLYYMRARYYDSLKARFLSTDPLQLMNPRRTNPYQYALNNPLENLDPSGLQPQPAPSVDIFTPTDAGFVSDVAFGSFEASANYAASGANATGTIEELANEGQLIEGAEAAHTLGTAFGAGINFYQEAKKASSEGKGVLAIAARGTLGAGVSIATGVALGPLNLVDGATGGNFSESIKQAYRAPEALLGDAAAGRAYEQAVSSGSYGIVAQQANYAGTVFSEQGIGQTLDQFFGGNWVSETWEGFSDAVGARMLGPLPDVYVPPPPHPRLPPPYVSKRQTPGKFLH